MSFANEMGGEQQGAPLSWPEGFARVPYALFQRPDIYAREQDAIFRGPYWHYLCLEVELPDAGSYRTTHIGDTSVIITRDADGEFYAFENRCAHRGALLALDKGGKCNGFTCVYHAWSYNRQGDLVGVAFKDGVKGEGGMPASFRQDEHGLRKLRIATLHGLVFGSFSEDVPPFRDYLGDTIIAHIARVLKGRKPVVLGRFTQRLPNNWKLYFENVKDSYHASILHLFFTTFEINHLSQRGGILVDESGGHHVSYSAMDSSVAKAETYAADQLRSNSGYTLADPSLLDGSSECGDDITLQILSVFPGFVLQQIQNAVAIRQIVPKGAGQTDLNWTYLGFEDDSPEKRAARLRQANLVGPAGFISMEDGCVGGFVQRGIAGSGDDFEVLEMGGVTAESSPSRVTEASIRGFWKAYRAAMGL